eukprot:CAMPEP_0196808664 /NCGR_PEP_ID=MMETSP1362-20130617/8649_1 /TAXON_ID=163516 /ORGANISM="Leptocylindrus danicus, Strain CCMP1856" /LENGTH=1290 /DNA_ID=CAMNT_0042183083 /DNA_START=114 /DNA_END=3986 /DNA_ORIENTATION=+
MFGLRTKSNAGGDDRIDGHDAATTTNTTAKSDAVADLIQKSMQLDMDLEKHAGRGRAHAHAHALARNGTVADNDNDNDNDNSSTDGVRGDRATTTNRMDHIDGMANDNNVDESPTRSTRRLGTMLKNRAQRGQGSVSVGTSRRGLSTSNVAAAADEDGNNNNSNSNSNNRDDNKSRLTRGNGGSSRRNLSSSRRLRGTSTRGSTSGLTGVPENGTGTGTGTGTGSNSVTDASANYGKAGALLERLMGKSKLQHASAVSLGTDTTNEYDQQHDYNGVGVDPATRLLSRPQESKSTNYSKPRNSKGHVMSRKKKSKDSRLHRMGSMIQHWPYDDYKNEYDELTSLASLQPPPEYDDGGDFEKGDNFERPAELPSIKVAVRNLPLAEFERMAEQRAIGIVSTWIYDSGLIDELLVSGASPTSPIHVSSEKSVKSQEGAELTLGGDMKMEREVDRLRRATEQELSFVNARLNDGVTSSGAEVQELVSAVAETRGEIEHLRRMFTYVAKGGDPKQNDYLLSGYPKLRGAINARKNLTRIFRELDFFAQIPSTCTRLREDLSAHEWSAAEYSTIRAVSLEHVELEVLLVEAEAGLKVKLGASGEGMEVVLKSSGASVNSKDMNADEKLKAVDDFLSSHVKNVWSLGKEIRGRVLYGIGNAFDLALNNPAGLVALVEAVEIYEAAAEQYQRKHADDIRYELCTLKFTNMRQDALKQLYEDFGKRGFEVFSNIHMQAADLVVSEEEAANTQFTSVLKGASELISEMDVVKYDMKPCFPPHWSIEVLWASSVAYVCSNNILQQIGGPEGNNLAELSLGQLLDLVGWIEYFRQQIYETFPNLANQETTEKTFFDTLPDIFVDGGKTLDVRTATDSIAWASNMMWEVHRKAQEEFMVRIRSQTEEFLKNVYRAQHSQHTSSDGLLISSLAEDVFSLIGLQIRTIRDSLTKGSDAFVLAVCVVFMQLRSRQLESRDIFLKDLESACAAANDFIRMGDKCEEVMAEIQRSYELDEKSSTMLDDCLSELLALYNQDAVFAAQSCHPFIFEPISEAISYRLFNEEWEQQLTSNQHAVTLVKTIEDFMKNDLESYLDSILYVKSIDALVPATVVFYVNCILAKSENHKNNKEGIFQDPARALNRMLGDIEVMKLYFNDLASDMPTLSKVIKKEFGILTAIHQCLCCAAHVSDADISDAILGLHIHIGDVNLTRRCVADLWHLVAPADERDVWDLMEGGFLESAPQNPPEFRTSASNRLEVPGLRLDIMLVEFYRKTKRKVQCSKASMIEKINLSLNDWVVEGNIAC